MNIDERGTLSPVGAQALRNVRDHILAHPKEFAMDEWECGTTACIGGHLARMGCGQRGDPFSTEMALGFNSDAQFHSSHPLHSLFYGFGGNRKSLAMESWPCASDGSTRDPLVAARHINAFLAIYGYPEHGEI